MASDAKMAKEQMRADYIKLVSDFLIEKGEDVLVTGSNEIAFPCVDSKGEDNYLVLTFKIPSGSRDGDSYDGYAMAEDYKFRLEEKAKKAEETARKKAEKIARDAKAREEKARLKAEREKEKVTE